MRSVILFTALAGAACATLETTDAPPGPPPAEPPDPWVLVIEAGRWNVLIDRAMEGAIIGPPAAPLVEPTDEERIDRDLRRGVLAMYALRAHVCDIALAGGEDCGPLPPPAWLGDPVGAPVSLEELQARSDWLAETAAPFIAAGCDAGNSRQDDGLFCSVE